MKHLAFALFAFLSACSAGSGPSAKGFSDLLAGRDCRWAIGAGKQLRFCRMPPEAEGEPSRWCCLDADGVETVCAPSEEAILRECRLPAGS